MFSLSIHNYSSVTKNNRLCIARGGSGQYFEDRKWIYNCYTAIRENIGSIVYILLILLIITLKLMSLGYGGLFFAKRKAKGFADVGFCIPATSPGGESTEAAALSGGSLTLFSGVSSLPLSSSSGFISNMVFFSSKGFM